MKKLIQSYKAIELAEQEGKTRQTIYNNGRLYIPIMVTSKRAKKGYSIRYIKKSDLNEYYDYYNSSPEKLVARYYKGDESVLGSLLLQVPLCIETDEEGVRHHLEDNREYWERAAGDKAKEDMVIDWVLTEMCGSEGLLSFEKELSFSIKKEE